MGAREEVEDHSEVITALSGYSAPIPAKLLDRAVVRSDCGWLYTHRFPSRSATAGTVSIESNQDEQRVDCDDLTQVNNARNDMSLYPKLLVATPTVDTMTSTNSMPYRRVLP